MKKRISCLFLLLTLTVSLFAGLSLPASAGSVAAVNPTGYTCAEDVKYVTAGGYTCNWGARGEDCTFLSSRAQAYYTGNYTFDKLSKNAGGTSQSNAPSSALYTALENMMVSKKTKETSYNGTRDLYKYTDCLKNDYAHISSFYSGKELKGEWDGGSTWNREHTWPNSKIDNNGENDIMMLRPTAVSENSSRGNKAYGESSGYYFPNSESDGKYDLRGDCARIVLFVYTRWGVTDKMWGTSGVMENVDILLKWMKEDPVDTWEMGRNDAVESIIGVRNVFVDYPEYAWLLFGQSVPTGYVSPSGGKSDTYTVTAVSNDEALGTVSVSGYTVTCKPAEGCYTADAKITKGEGTLQRSGNTVTVSPKSDCTVTVTFAETKTVTVSFVLPVGVTKNAVTVPAGSNVTLSAPSGAPALSDHTYTFAGWLDRELADTTVKPDDLIAPGTGMTVAENLTLYAVYSYTEQAQEDVGDYVKVTAEPDDWSGSYVLVYEGENFLFDSSLEVLDGKSNYREAGAIVGQTVAAEIADPCRLTVEQISGGYSVRCANGAYIGMTASDNGILQAETPYANTIRLGENGEADIVSANCHLRFNTQSGQKRFRYYKADSFAAQKDVFLYRKAGAAVTHWLTLDGICPHQWDGGRPEEHPTCTEPGSALYTCLLCEATKYEPIPALGHDYDELSGICSRCHELDPNYQPPYPIDPCEGYTDIDREGWYHTYADFVIDRGLMGTTNPDGLTFEPNTSCTRSMIVTILYSLAGKPEVDFEDQFPDVKDNQWYTDPVMWAYQNEIVSGYDTGYFGTNDKVTREQLAVIFKAYAEKIEKRDTSVRAELADFADSNKVTWSKDAVAWAVAAGLISGKPGANGTTLLDPQGKASRAEVAVILTKFLSE